MATTSTIGTSSRNYSTIASWLAAFTTGGWIGECYNDSEFVITAGIDFTGHSTSAANYITLTTAAGQSYRDNASVQTNAFAYNQANGVGVRNTSLYQKVFNIVEDYVTISNLQIQNITSGTGEGINNNISGSTNCIVENCIIEADYRVLMWRAGTVRNCLLVLGASGGTAGVEASYPAGTCTLANCTLVRPSNFTLGGNGLKNATSGGFRVVNCAVYGFTNFVDTSTSMTGSNNSSDTTIGFGTSNQASKTYANQFVTTTNSGRDFKTKTGADLLDNGSTDTTDIPAAIDAVGTSRPQSTAWDIGAWELVAAAPPATTHQFRMLMGAG